MLAICWTVLAAVVELLRDLGLVRGEAGPAATLAAAGPGGGQAVAGVGDDEFPLQLSEHGEHAEHGPALHGAGVDALLIDLEPDGRARAARRRAARGGPQSGRAGPVSKSEVVCTADQRCSALQWRVDDGRDLALKSAVPAG